MSDNVLISQGSGAVIAADEVSDGTLGSVKVQYVKIMDGTLDGTTKATVGASGLAVSAAQSGTWNVTNISGTVSLPTGASTSAKQDTGNTSLSSIDGKIPALGQALAAGSVPIVLTASQLTTLTPLSSVTVTQGTATNLHVAATLDAETTKVIGTVNLSAAQTLATVTTVGTVTTITNQVDTNLKQVGGSNTVTGGVNGTLAVGGNVATNVAIGTNPVNLGAQAVSAENTAVTATRMAQLVTDLVGKLIVLPYANPENFVSGAITSAMTGTTSTSLIGAPAGSLRNYITQITVSNSHATVGTDVIIQDGSGGTTLYVIPAAPAYGGATVTFPVPLRQPTTATAIYCANVTTGSSIKVSASGYKGV